MRATIYISGVIGKDTNLIDVIRQFKSYENPTEVEAIINSVGGCVANGESIYTYLQNLTIPVTTITEKAFSIAAHIAMSGTTRIVLEGERRFMMHLPLISDFTGNSKELDYVSAELKKIETRFKKFYSQHLNIDETTIENLLNKETFMSGAECLELGIATEVRQPLKAVAQFDINNLKLNMTKDEKGFFSYMAEYFKVKPELEIKALMLQDSTGVEIDFPELEADAVPEVGTKAEIESKPIPDGEYIMPQLENATVVFESGVIIEIKPEEKKTEDSTEDSTEVEAVAFDEDALINKVITALEAKFQAISKENKANTDELKAVKKLLGSSEATVVAQENNTERTNNKPKSYLR